MDQLEITESAILDDPGHAVENLKRLHALGCQIAIDDYGTGYSSLAYLRRLPLHELKIDKSFVMGMSGDASDDVIVRSTIELAHNMGLMVVAEGVEDEADAGAAARARLRHGAGIPFEPPDDAEPGGHLGARLDGLARRARTLELAAGRLAARCGSSGSPACRDARECVV